MFEIAVMNRGMRRLALSALLAFSACASQQRAEPVAAPAAGSGQPTFLWKTTLPEQPGVVYVLGSVHLERGDAQLDRSITDAVTAADDLVFEIDLDAPADDLAQWFAENGLYRDGESIEQDISAETLAALRGYLAREGIAEANVLRMRPWMVAITLPVIVMREDGYTSNSGVDFMVHRFGAAEPSRARAMHALETARFQAELIMSLEELDADTLVGETIRTLEEGMAEKLFDYYRAGDEAALAAFLAEARRQSPENETLYARIVDDRNRGMVDGMLPFYAKPTSTVVTVGALHLVGEGGILQLLRGRGALVENVASTGDPPEKVAAMFAPTLETYRAADGGFTIEVAETVSHLQQHVPVSGGDSLQVDIYQIALTAKTTMLINVTRLPRPVELAPEALEQVTLQSLASIKTPARYSEPATVASRPALKSVGGSAERSAVCWALGAGNRVVSILSVNDSAKPDPEGEQKTAAILDSLRIVEPGQ